MLEKLLFTNTQKQIVGVSLTPGVGLEVAIYDRNKNTVLKYGRRKIEYNFSTREIQDYVEFKSALSELIQELNIQPKSLAYLVLPNVYFDFIEVPANITDEEIKTALLSRAEEFYLFKKEEPASGWCQVANINDPTQKRLAYSSFQKNAIENLKDIFNDFAIQLVGVESSYSATIRGLYSVGLIDDVILKRDSWTAMIINTNSFTLMHFDADNLLECAEVPIAIKSFSAEEAYGAIASSASQLLDSFSASKLYIMSQTDDVCAEILKNQMQVEKEIETIDFNKYSKKPIVEILESADFNAANSMTLGVIGASSIKTDFSLLINAMADDPAANLGVYFTTSIFGIMVDITSELAMKLSIIISAFLAVVFLILVFILNTLDKNFEKSVTELQSKVDSIQGQIKAESTAEIKQEINMNEVIDEVALINVKAIKYYDSIASDIPKNIWLTKYYNLAGDKIVIQGVAENIADIYEYFKNLKAISPESDIKLNELKVLTEDNGSEILKNLYVNSNNSRLYSFEISNTSVNYNTDDLNVDQNSENADDENVIIRPSDNVEQLSEQVRPAS